MKIICRTSDGSLFVKPETSITRIDWPFFVPDWSKDVIAEVSLAARVNHLGKSIPERFAHRYFDQVTMAVNFRTRDIYNELIAANRPTDIATGFDGSCYLGEWVSLTDLPEDWNISVTRGDVPVLMNIGDVTIANRLSSNLLIELKALIAEVSKYYLLKTGDIVISAPLYLLENVKEEDVISSSLAGREVTRCRCK